MYPVKFQIMKIPPLNILLADDDDDDCYLFQEALEELSIEATLRIAKDGEKLIQVLTNHSNTLPDVLFLDLNMPRKTGIECLSEIKNHEKLKQFPVIIYSTSFDFEVVNLLYEKGASHYICKQGEFDNLKKVILTALTIIAQKEPVQPSKENFIIQV